MPVLKLYQLKHTSVLLICLALAFQGLSQSSVEGTPFAKITVNEDGTFEVDFLRETEISTSILDPYELPRESALDRAKQKGRIPTDWKADVSNAQNQESAHTINQQTGGLPKDIRLNVPLLAESSKAFIPQNQQSNLPNLTYYTGAGSNNQYFFNSSSNVLEVYTSVLNNGVVTAGAFRTGFFLSVDPVIGAGDLLVQTYTSPGLSPGYYSNLYAITDLDNFSIAPGTYYVGVYHDDLGTIPELYETDNSANFNNPFSFVPPGVPNLTFYTGSGANNSFYIDPNHVLEISTSVANDGTGSATNFRIGYYLSPDNVIAVNDFLVGTTDVVELQSGFYNTFGGIVDLDNTGLPPGIYFVGIIIDDYGSVVESNEYDNATFYTPSFPYPQTSNLAVYTGSGSNNSYFLNNQNVLEVYATVGNYGAASSGPFRTGFYLSVDQFFDVNDLLIGSANVADLISNNYMITGAVADLNNFNISPGTYYLGAYFDDIGQVVETDETDNGIFYDPPISFNQSSGDPNISISPGSLTLEEADQSTSTIPVDREIEFPKISIDEQLSHEHHPEEMIVKMHPELSNDLARQHLIDIGYEVLWSYKIVHNAFLVKAKGAKAPDGLREQLSILGVDEYVQFVEPNYIVRHTGERANTFPNDPGFDALFGMHNTGQTGGMPDADIDAPEAWEISTGSSSIVVGIIDSGIDYDHPDLIQNMWVNPNEIPNNGVDDDGNGYVDDIYGWDFKNNDNNPFDGNGHGTHVAGTVGASGNNGAGVVGVNWNVKLMALKFLGDNDGGSNGAAMQAIEYAKYNGAHLTNNSWGGPGYDPVLEQAIINSNSLFVVAAGNGGDDGIGDDVDYYPDYPVSFRTSNMIGVASLDHNNNISSFSNFGANNVHLGAFGEGIVSCRPDNFIYNEYLYPPGWGLNDQLYAVTSGTSMACPQVAGVAALVLSVNPNLNWSELKDIILSSVDPISSMSGITATGGKLNAYNALTNVTPGDPSSFKISNTGQSPLEIYSINSSDNWLGIGGYSGQTSLAPGGNMTITADVDWSQVYDTSSGTITVNSNDPDQSSVSLAVTAIPAQTTTYTVTTSSSPAAGGSTTGDGTYNPNSTVTVTATASDGYSFLGWEESGSLVSTNSVYTFTATVNRDLVANFEQGTFVVSASANPTEGGQVFGAGTYVSNQVANMIAVASSEYEFVNWTENNVEYSTNSTYSFTVESARDLVANFSVKTFNVNVTVDPSAGGTVSGDGNYPINSTATLSINPHEGYDFDGWYENGTLLSTDLSYSFTVLADHDISANLTIRTYQITAEAKQTHGGTVSGGGTYDYGANVTLIATPNSGYGLLNWLEGGVEIANDWELSFVASEDRDIEANFQQGTYQVDVVANPVEGGSVSGGGLYTINQEITIQALPNVGYDFSSWSESINLVSNDASYTFNVTGSIVLEAVFDIKTFEVITTAEPSDGGTIDGSGTYSYGSSVSLEAVSHEGYEFVGWSENGTVVSADPVYSFVVDDAVHMTAHFEELQILSSDVADDHKVTILPNPATTYLQVKSEFPITVRIHSISGKRILETTDMELDISQFTPGLYQVVVTTEDHSTYTFKLVKE